MSDDEVRRLWLMPPAAGVMDDLDLSLLDPDDEDQRSMLILAEHPELWKAIEADRDEIVLEGVGTMSPQLHLTMHAIVANQIWDNDPQEMWTTAQRLTRAGYDRHEVLHMLASVVSKGVYKALAHEAPYDLERTRRALGALPESWEQQRAAPPMNRADRRAHARRRPR